MNLTTDAWIPALRADGTRALFSLQDLFAGAHTLRDLAAKPHERIALMRLLLCITQAALDGPADEDEWQNCRDALQPRVHAYLEKWRDSFELFGDGPRFLQLPNLKPGNDTDKGNAATKLDLALATGNNSTLFDNGAGEDRTVAAARAALNLLTFQCFSPGGLIGLARWNGQETPGGGKSKHAPCTPSSMLHTFVLGASLLDTVARNLLTKDLVASNIVKGWGQAPWEIPVTSATDGAAIENATLTYLGRLVPYSRALRINEAGERIILGNGLYYPIYPAYREATATVVLRKDEPSLLPASTGRGIWRQLHAITVKRRADADGTAGPPALSLNAFRQDSALWIGAFVTDKAKIEDLLEATYNVPPALFDPFGRAAYESGVKHAEASESNVMKAIGAYASALKVDGPAYDRARQHFWTRVEQSLGDLFTVARELTPPEQLGESPWGRAVRAAAIEAYERSCPRRTPRQIQAYALGLRHLFASAKSFKPAKPTRAKISDT
jgi:CRISPR system Cascade subunit CasA